MPRKRLIVATANRGKLAEFRDMLAGWPFELTSLGELELASPEETGATFLDNAMLKARHAARCSGLTALADDSGLEVDILGGAPGVRSARYAGEFADDEANNAKLLASLRAIDPQRASYPWRARYRCVLVLVPASLEVRDPRAMVPLIAEGSWEGVIVETPLGHSGFGYDPYFWLPQLAMTAAQLSSGKKNRLSHRGAALHALQANQALQAMLAAM